MKMHKLLLLAVACTWALGAAAQWQWIDKDGRKVFSDRPPPAEVPANSILKQPGGAPVARPATTPEASSAENATPAAAASKPAAKPVAAGKDKELENGGDTPTYVAGTENFYAITRYNWSSYYAMAVIELGREVAAARSAALASSR